MTVYVAGYRGTETDFILGVFTDIEKAKESIHEDYKGTPFGYEPNVKEIDDSHIYVAEQGLWFDEWYVVETELYN